MSHIMQVGLNNVENVAERFMQEDEYFPEERHHEVVSLFKAIDAYKKVRCSRLRPYKFTRADGPVEQKIIRALGNRHFFRKKNLCREDRSFCYIAKNRTPPHPKEKPPVELRCDGSVFKRETNTPSSVVEEDLSGSYLDESLLPSSIEEMSVYSVSIDSENMFQPIMSDSAERKKLQEETENNLPLPDYYLLLQKRETELAVGKGPFLDRVKRAENWARLIERALNAGSWEYAEEYYQEATNNEVFTVPLFFYDVDGVMQKIDEVVLEKVRALQDKIEELLNESDEGMDFKEEIEEIEEEENLERSLNAGITPEEKIEEIFFRTGKVS